MKHLMISASLSVNIASVSVNDVGLLPSLSVCLYVGLSVGLSVRKMYCGKMAD